MNFSDPHDCIVDQGFRTGPIAIEDEVWTGNGVIINKAVYIGKGSILGAGSVLNHYIPPYSVVAGLPCRVIRKRE